mmetsp:Transcript_96074/g.275920  ORF Transcript_96074/g.275920 Transcript_96074/m.275920 type:complete len:221 (-) Transcript_96074:1143-1805(-)
MADFRPPGHVLERPAGGSARVAGQGGASECHLERSGGACARLRHDGHRFGAARMLRLPGRRRQSVRPGLHGRDQQVRRPQSGGLREARPAAARARVAGVPRPVGAPALLVGACDGVLCAGGGYACQRSELCAKRDEVAHAVGPAQPRRLRAQHDCLPSDAIGLAVLADTRPLGAATSFHRGAADPSSWTRHGVQREHVARIAVCCASEVAELSRATKPLQ